MNVLMFERYIASFILLCVMLPYISPIRTGFDAQPYAIITSFCYLLYLIINNAKIVYSKIFLLLVLYLFIAVFIAAIEIIIKGSDIIVVVRAVANYISITFLPIIIIIMFFRGLEYKKIIVFCIGVYFISALLQYVISVDLFSVIIDARTTESRGVTSLTPEPTYYGIICYLINIIILISNKFTKKERLFYSIVLFMQTILLAKSSMALMFYLLLGLSFLFSRKNLLIGVFIVLLLTLMVTSIISLEYFEGSRIRTLINFFIENGTHAFIVDASMNDRLSHIYFALYGFYEDFLTPHGYTQFEYLLNNREELSGGIFWYGESSNKIMSYIGANVYEMGIISFIYFYAVYQLIPRGKMKTFSFGVLIPLFACIPLSNPLVALIIGILYTEDNKDVYDITSG